MNVVAYTGKSSVASEFPFFYIFFFFSSQKFKACGLRTYPRTLGC